ncbi:sugar phosphate isomerase/epimerase family protein [Paenibacillus sepulcri]|uniref:Sugar phosphate isomerase/epimerase n=1 Tax=Paenibacillus sepulcri TaxID=359917 RepID=A0ABS7BY66_9BACL|nr:sugar phosphate isomerase/epimerase [Paenibacillus sepulcri]
MRLVTSTNLFGKGRNGRMHTPYIESVRRCRQAGFKVLDFSFVEFFFTRTELWEEDWQNEIYMIRNEAERLGVTFSQSHLPYNPGYMPTWKNEEQRLLYVKHMERSVLASSMLGVSWGVVHPFTQCEETEFDEEASIQFNHQFYADSIELALKNGVGIAFENMIEYPEHRKFSARAEELAALADSFNDKRIGVCWDFGHGHRMYRDLSRPVKVLGSRLVALHVNDNTAISDQHFTPFMGTVNWEEAIDALWSIGYSGDFTYEIYGLTKQMPEALKDISASYAYQIGKYCVDRFHAHAAKL